MEERNEITGSGPIESVSSVFSNKKSKNLTEEEKKELERRELGPNNYNRKVRRSQLKRAGVLKMKNKLGVGTKEWEEWYEKTRTEGKRLFQENEESVRKQQTWYLERIDEKRREYFTKLYTDMGLSKKEVKDRVDSQQEIWYKTVLGNKEKIEERKAKNI